jgi:hypothetical protein
VHFGRVFENVDEGSPLSSMGMGISKSSGSPKSSISGSCAGSGNCSSVWGTISSKGECDIAF